MTAEVARDTIAIGTSAGGVEALPRLLGQLGRELDATVLVVQHLAPTRDTILVDILNRATALPVAWAEQGGRAAPGHVYVAPPNAHLVVDDGYLRLTGGARENHARPSIDRLFRSVAAERGARVVGVLLTGLMDDGVAGLSAIHAAGGLTIVQDPADAEFPELPSRALAASPPDLVLPLSAIGAALLDQVGRAAPTAAIPRAVAREHDLDHEPAGDPRQLDELGVRVPQTCPECHGPMWELGDSRHRRYRCYLGHAATARDLLDQSAEEIEAALWNAVRALRDRAMTFQQLAADAGPVGSLARQAYDERAAESLAQAEVARKFMLELARHR